MDERGIGWFRFVPLLFAGMCAAAAPMASADEASSAEEARHRSVLARRPEVKLRERPEENSPTVELSLTGVRLRARSSPGNWLQVDSYWLRATDVVELENAIDYFSAEIARAGSEFAYLGRARAWLARNQYDKAQSDVGEALVSLHSALGLTCCAAGSRMN